MAQIRRLRNESRLFDLSSEHRMYQLCSHVNKKEQKVKINPQEPL